MPVVSVGTITITDMFDAIYPVISAPSGEVFRSINGAVPAPLTATCDLYVSGAIQEADSYQWFIQETSGDEGAGAGWKKLVAGAGSFGTSGYTTKTLTVPASSVPSSESFKCRATYNGTAYYGAITFRDLTDPYQVILDCPQGDSFFNNTGAEKTLTARVYQNGVEVDANGTIFAYAWQRFIGGVQDVGYAATTNSIKINAADVVKEATYICNISTKP